MAIVIQSFSSTVVNTSNKTIPAPSGLQVGDLLLIRIWIAENKNITITNGATSIRRDANPADVYSQLYWHIATATEVSSGIPYTLSGGAINAGMAYRITGADSTNPISGSSTDNTISSAATVVFTMGLTPTYASSAYFIFTTSSDMTGNLSNYTIATSNPTWTEDYDVNNQGAKVVGASCARAIRPETTATGNITISNSSSYINGLGQFVIINPVIISGPTNLKSYNTNLKANIKSINTNLIANVKTLDTNA